MDEVTGFVLGEMERIGADRYPNSRITLQFDGMCIDNVCTFKDTELHELWELYTDVQESVNAEFEALP